MLDGVVMRLADLFIRLRSQSLEIVIVSGVVGGSRLSVLLGRVTTYVLGLVSCEVLLSL